MPGTKILIISHDAELQGAERSLLDLVTNIDRSQIQPLVLVPWRGPLFSKLSDAGIPCTVRYVAKWIPTKKRRNLRALIAYIETFRTRLWSLLHLIEREGIDLVYTNTSTILDGAIAARVARVPHIWHVHEYLSGNPDLSSYVPNGIVDRVIQRLSDTIIVPSKSLGKERFPRGGEKIFTIPNGVSLECDLASKVGTKGQPLSKQRRDTPLITFIGSLSPTKDPLTFIKAAKIVSEQHTDAVFQIVGDTCDEDYKTRVRQAITNANLLDRCHLLGYRHDVKELLAQATVHVSTSVRESFGRTLIEAMACAKPVVATRCGGPEEVVVHGETGYVVEPRNSGAIAACIIELLNSPSTAKRLGLAGRLRAENHFRSEDYAKRVTDVILRTIREHEVETKN